MGVNLKLWLSTSTKIKYNQLNHAGLKSVIPAPVPALLGGGDAGDEGWIARDTGSFWRQKPLINLP